MTTPIALTIAGSDCSGGAGIQADLKTFASFGVHGLTAVTSVVSETPLIVSQIHPVPPVILQDQLRLLLETYPVGAIKTGMLYSKSHIVATCEILAEFRLPLVVDPVMVASTGDPLLAPDALEAISVRLLPLATILTPNLPEARLLLNRTIDTESEQEKAAQDLARRFSASCYLKGGHFEGQDEHRDFLATPEGSFSFRAKHLEVAQSHGTGCTLSAALAAGLARHHPLERAAREAHRFTHEALRNRLSWRSPHSGHEVTHLLQNQPAPPKN